MNEQSKRETEKGKMKFNITLWSDPHVFLITSLCVNFNINEMESLKSLCGVETQDELAKSILNELIRDIEINKEKIIKEFKNAVKTHFNK